MKKLLIVVVCVICVFLLVFILNNKKEERNYVNNNFSVIKDNPESNNQGDALEKTSISEDSSKSDNNSNLSTDSATSSISSVDRIEVFLFHATQRCVSCINIGKYAKQVIENNFSKEVSSGKIVFKEINIDLDENKDLVEKFQASGSALFINTVRKGKDDIKQDTTVWRLVGNQSDFDAYLKGELSSILNS